MRLGVGPNLIQDFRFLSILVSSLTSNQSFLTVIHNYGLFVVAMWCLFVR